MNPPNRRVMGMSGVFSVLSDAQAGRFRLMQAKKPWEQEIAAKDAKGQLAEKAARAADQPFGLTPEQLRDHATARAALEEAKRVGGPKAAAEQRLEEVERKIEELKLAMRFAHGDRRKLAQLAHAAALLAREAGRAAKDYGIGVANAAAMGLPGGTGAIGTTEVTTRVTTTSLTIRQTERTVTLRVTSGAAAEPMAAMPDGAAAAGLPAPEAGQVPALPDEVGRLIDGALSGLAAGGSVITGLASSGSGDGGPDGVGLDGGNPAQAAMRRMMADHDLAMSRYREADAFGRRVEDVLYAARRVVGEAKVANAWDESESRRKERRDLFKTADRMIDEARSEVDGLRRAAFGSADPGSDITADGVGASGEAGGLVAAGLPSMPSSAIPCAETLDLLA
jgi:hypothetical protein